MSQDGRRRFLTGSAVAAVGAIAAGLAPKPAGAAEDGAKPGGASGNSSRYYPNDSLALAIVRAWSDESFKKRLLTFPEDGSADWDRYSEDGRQKMIRSTREALAEVNVFLDSPVVLTLKQYAGYKKKDEEKEVVFTLPSPSLVYAKNYSLDTAKVAMAGSIDGM